MARVAGVDLPPNKRAQIGLTYIYGIGKSRATAILGEAEIGIDTKIRDLSEDELTQIRAILDAQGNIEGDLRKRVQMDVKRLMDIGCYPISVARWLFDGSSGTKSGTMGRCRCGRGWWRRTSGRRRRGGCTTCSTPTRRCLQPRRCAPRSRWPLPEAQVQGKWRGRRRATSAFSSSTYPRRV